MRTFLSVSVFVAGFVVMGAEMSAPRLLAPYLGASHLVWTAVIGVVLTALTVGAVVGGRIADRVPSRRALAGSLLLAGVFLTLVPLAAGPILAGTADVLVNRELGGFFAAFGAISLLFVPAVLLLGMVTPWAIRLGGIDRPDLGRVAGNIAGWSAAGSILGTFLVPLVALPMLGTRRTLLALGLVLVVLGVVWLTPRWTARAAALLLALGAVASYEGRVHDTPKVLYEVESPYQHVWVTGNGRGRAELMLNEGIGTQSVMGSRGAPSSSVWEAMAAIAATALPQGPERTGRVLVLGLAGGTVVRAIQDRLPENADVVFDGVEIDPFVVEAARRFFDLDGIENLNVHVGDARRFLDRSDERYDVVIGDSFRGFYVPAHLVTIEFFEDVRAHLSDGGVFVLNLAVEARASTVIGAITDTMQTTFPHLARTRLGGAADVVNLVYAASDAPLPSTLARIFPRLQTRFRDPDPERDWILSDDRSPVEVLMDFDLIRGAM